MSAGFELDEAVVAAVAGATSRPVGYGKVPTSHGTTYLLVTPGGGPPPLGDMGSRTSNKDHRYMIRCVGEDQRQVRWLKDKVYERLLAGPQLLPEVQWVSLEADGAIVPDGEALYSAIDNYLVRV